MLVLPAVVVDLAALPDQRVLLARAWLILPPRAASLLTGSITVLVSLLTRFFCISGRAVCCECNDVFWALSPNKIASRVCIAGRLTREGFFSQLYPHP